MSGATVSAKVRGVRMSFTTALNAVKFTLGSAVAKNAIAPSAAFVMVAYNSKTFSTLLA